MITGIDDEWVYCFDSYRRLSIRGLRQNVKVIKSYDPRAPNLKIRREWLDQIETKRFCLGPVQIRESLMIWRTS